MKLDNIRCLFSDDEKGVSPVIGVILMVAITVILAAVIGTFVLGLGQELPNSQAPSVNLEFDYKSGSNSLTVTHSGGDTVSSDRLTIVSTTKYNHPNLQSATKSAKWTKLEGGTTEVQAGNSLTLTSVDPGSTVRVVWTSEGGGSSQTLTDFQVP